MIASEQRRILDRLAAQFSEGYPLLLSNTKPGSNAPGKRFEYTENTELPVDYRNVRSCELVLEMDEGGEEAISEYHKRIHDFLKRRRIPFLVSDTGGKGYHHQIFFQFDATDLDRVQGLEPKFIRTFLIETIEKEAQVPTGGDRACSRWTERGQGQLIRTFGGRKYDKEGELLGFKTLIDEPERGGFRVTDPENVVFPDEIPTWTVWPTYVDSMLEAWKNGQKRKETRERTSLGEFKDFEGDYSVLPCVQRLLSEGAPRGKRNESILDVIAAFRLDGAARGIANDKALAFVNSCPEAGDYTEDKVASIVQWVFNKPKEDVFFSCGIPQGLGFCAEDCKLKLHKQSEYFLDSGKPLMVKIANDIMSRHYFLTMEDDLKVIYHYNPETGVYEKHGDNVIKVECAHGFGFPLSSHWVNEVLSYIQTSTFTPRKKMDGEEFSIHLKNGIFDLEKEELLPFSPERIATVALPITYEQGAECPTVEQFFNDVFITQEQINLVEEMMGFCLIKSYKFQVLFIIVGKGANGKGKFMALIPKFLGKDNVCGVSLQDLETKNFSRHKLHGMLANCFPDLSDKALHTTEALKILTGEDRFFTDVKHSVDGIHMQNYAKMIFATNEPPSIREDNYAIWRRVILIECNNRFVAGENADPDILDKITTEKELSGLFNLAVRSLKRLLKRGHFEYCLDETEIRNRYIRASDSLKWYAEKELVEIPGGEVTKSELYCRYKHFCKEENLKPKTMDYVGKHLVDHIDTESDRQSSGDRRNRVWVGIGFKSVVKVPSEQNEGQEGIEKFGGEA